MRSPRQMKGHGKKFARKKDEAIAALLSHRTLEEAARAVGISPNALLRWQQDPEFDAAFRKARRGGGFQSVAYGLFRRQQISFRFL